MSCNLNAHVKYIINIKQVNINNNVNKRIIHVMNYIHKVNLNCIMTKNWGDSCSLGHVCKKKKILFHL